jgi:hypothetical protein
MDYLSQCEAIATRIRGLGEAAELQARYRAVSSAEDGSSRYLRDQCQSVLEDLEGFQKSFGGALPVSGAQAISRVLNLKGGLSEPGQTIDTIVQRLRQVLVELRAFESEMTYLLTDTQQRFRSIAERAFQHLRRLIVVDSDVKRKWGDAFERGEVACERLGATHLLWHGIFAFKVDAAGARTDLVYGEDIPKDAAGYVQAIVLTEWKIAKDEKVARAKLEEARSQVKSYAEAPLAAIELRNIRYLVVVTASDVNLPPDETRGSVIYRHINIPVKPDLPSVAARR